MNPPADKNRRVLVIDDNRAIHDDFRKILSPDKSASLAMDASEANIWDANKRDVANPIPGGFGLSRPGRCVAGRQGD